jgi:hypothetical protein
MSHPLPNPNGFTTWQHWGHALLRDIDTRLSNTHAHIADFDTEVITEDLSASGNIDFSALPSSDPGVPGRLYRTGGAVMVSL